MEDKRNQLRAELLQQQQQQQQQQDQIEQAQESAQGETNGDAIHHAGGPGAAATAEAVDGIDGASRTYYQFLLCVFRRRLGGREVAAAIRKHPRATEQRPRDQKRPTDICRRTSMCFPCFCCLRALHLLMLFLRGRRDRARHTRKEEEEEEEGGLTLLCPRRGEGPPSTTWRCRRSCR